MRASLLVCALGVAMSASLTSAVAQTPVATPVAAPGATPVAVAAAFAEIGLQTPESVLYDAADDVYLVSNINGSPMGEDDNGFISRLAPDGGVIDLMWIDGASEEVELNAPKGLGIVGDTLYVADLTVVRLFDRLTGQPTGTIEIPGATFLNDVATAPDGTVYVSDTGFRATADGGSEPSGTDAVHRITADGSVEAIATAPEISTPNGLAVLDSGAVVVVPFDDSGQVYALGPDGQREELA